MTLALPLYVLRDVLLHLDHGTLAICGRTCQDWERLASAAVWRHVEINTTWDKRRLEALEYAIKEGRKWESGRIKSVRIDISCTLSDYKDVRSQLAIWGEKLRYVHGLLKTMWPRLQKLEKVDIILNSELGYPDSMYNSVEGRFALPRRVDEALCELLGLIRDCAAPVNFTLDTFSAEYLLSRRAASIKTVDCVMMTDEEVYDQLLDLDDISFLPPMKRLDVSRDPRIYIEERVRRSVERISRHYPEARYKLSAWDTAESKLLAARDEFYRHFFAKLV